jgi:regulatory protein
LSSEGRALALAYRFINRRERTVAEVRSRLGLGELPEDEIEDAINELVEFGYLDDGRYARVFVQDRRTLDAWGNERIARVLRERGVDRALIDEALRQEDGVGWNAEGESTSTTELDRAVVLLSQRFPTGPTDPRDRERAFGVLIRKGYETETASDAVREWARQAAV